MALSGDRVFFLDGWLGLRSFRIADGPKEQRRDGVLYPIKSVWNVWLKGVRPYN